MNTGRKVQQGKDGPLYISVRDGSFIKIDRQSYLRDSEIDYIIFTQLTGFGHEGMGVVR